MALLIQLITLSNQSLAIKDICQKMNLCILLPLMLAGVTTATSFSSTDEHNPNCIEASHYDAMLSLSSCLNGCVQIHSVFVDVDNDDVNMIKENITTTASSTTKNKLKTSYSQMKAAALLLLFILAFATMEAHQLILLMTMLIVSGGLSTDVVIGFFGAWLVIYLGVLKETEQGEDGYDIEKDMYYDCSEEETQSSFGLTWKE